MSTIQRFTNGQFDLAVDPHPTDGFRVQAPGLAKALSVSDAYTLLRSIPEEEKGSAVVRTLGGDQTVGYVTEAGFYRALGMRQTGRIQDDMVRARVEAFQNWVYREVLPSLRTAGQYVMPQLSQEEQLVLLARQVIDQSEQLKIAEPKIEAFDELMHASGVYSMEAAAKALGYGRNVLFRELRKLGILQGNNLPYQRYVHHFDVKVGTRRNSAGETIPTYTTWVRPSGLDYLRRRLAQAQQAVEQAGILV